MKVHLDEHYNVLPVGEHPWLPVLDVPDALVERWRAAAGARDAAEEAIVEHLRQTGQKVPFS